jgi:biopolymer transport protein ExbD
MHKFKRFYLLGALLFSLLVPALVFTEYVEATPLTEIQNAGLQQTAESDKIINVPPALEADVLDIAPLLWGIYFLGLFFFGLKFVRNLFQIFRRIRRNPKHKLARITQVLLLEKISPHTFFSYIFLNKTKFESKQIPEEVLLHEETHAQQKHSWDVVFVELLQVIFWVNPFIYLAKKAIKLNHEFLADQAVLRKNVDETTYKNTLLSYLSPDSEKKYQPQLANAINYSSIKKRFTVMKTHTSKKAIYLRTLLLLPLLAVLLYGFSETKVIETAPIVSEQLIHTTLDNQLDLIENIRININQTGRLLVQDKLVALEDLKDFLSKINAHLSTQQKQQVVRSTIYVEAETPKNIIKEVNNILTEYGSATINIVGTDDNITQKEATKEQLLQFNTLANKYNKQPQKSRIVPLNDLKILEVIYGKMSEKQKANAQPFPECPPIDKPLQDGASRKLMTEYNKLAKHYNDMPRSKMKIKKKDVDRLEHIYGLMSGKQKADAEPFPDFPPMPLPPKAPKAPKAPKVKKGVKSGIPPPPPPAPDHEENEEVMALEEEEALIEKHEYRLVKKERLLKKAEANLERKESELQEKEVIIIEKQAELDDNEEDIEVVYHIKKGDESHISEPPTPPTPKSPLDHVIEMAKQGATFYYKKKKITSDEAIAIIKKNEDLSMDISKRNNESPVVKIDTHL